jgi:hypothetical protein
MKDAFRTPAAPVTLAADGFAWLPCPEGHLRDMVDVSKGTLGALSVSKGTLGALSVSMGTFET